MKPRDASLKALRRHRAPTWWKDAKLGIMVHWTPASVPAFAPTDATIGELLASGARDALKDVPYAEWYENSLRFDDSQVSLHHRERYGDRPYSAFARDFEAGLERWDPDLFARTFAESGAKYVVFVAKHSDGYSLWPTDVTHPVRAEWHSERDIVGEMADAVRSVGLRFGIYYCGGFDWSFDDRRVGSIADSILAVPRGPYPAYAEAQVRELIDRYRPSVLWNDVAWPARAKRLRRLMADYYRAVPDGVLNDRWMPWSPMFEAARLGPVARLINRGAARSARQTGGLVAPRPPHFDVRTPEYASFDEIQASPFELVRGMDKSFAYNQRSRPEDFLTRGQLLEALIDVVAKGGNLLVDVGPRGADATIPDVQLTRLQWLGAFMDENGRALFGTQPWVVAGSTTSEGAWIRYTSRGEHVFAFIDAADGTKSITLAEVTASPSTTIETLDGTPLRWQETSVGVRLDLAPTTTPSVVVLCNVDARRISGP
jgi:alpha-L-fucosidase